MSPIPWSARTRQIRHLASSIVFATTLVASIPIIGTSRSEPCEVPTKIDWSHVAPEIRPQLYVNVGQLPQFPEDNDSLMHVRWWPAFRTFDGVVYRLEFSASHYDVTRLNLASMSDIDSGWDYNAHYVTYSLDGKRSSGRGPSYYWRSDSTLSERGYAAPGGTREWLYDREGRIYQYSFHKYDSKELRMSGVEWFAENGALVGCRFGIRGGAGFVGRAYWMGREADSNELERLLVRFFHWKYGGG